MKEKVTYIWADNFSFTFTVKSIQEQKKVLNVIKRRGNPTQIIGEGDYANLARRELQKYNADPSRYGGLPIKDALRVGASTVGIPFEKLEKKLKNLNM